MYMPDAIRATMGIMNAPADSVKIRSSYNLSGMSFSPQDLYEEITKKLPEFSIVYKPDFRQEIADSWPASIDDIAARTDWNWKPDFDLTSMTKDMLLNLEKVV
jgi:nucleoside-diphosphate-sugar epimerase